MKNYLDYLSTAIHTITSDFFPQCALCVAAGYHHEDEGRVVWFYTRNPTKKNSIPAPI